MGLEILRMLIERRNKSIDKDYVKPASFDYLVDTKNNINDIDKVITSYLHIITKRPIEQCEEIVKSLKVNDVSFTEADFTMIVDFLTNLKDTSNLKAVKEYMQAKSIIKEIKCWKQIDLDNSLSSTIMPIKSLIKKHKIDVDGLFDLLENNYDAFLDLSSIVIEHKAKNSDLTVAMAKKVLYTMMSRRNEEFFVSRKSDRIGKMTPDGAKQYVKKYVEEIEREAKNHSKQVKLEIYYNEQALELLEKELKKPEITNIRPLIKRIADPKIKEIILAIVYKHNVEYIKELNKEYEKLMSNSTTRYLSLLNEFGITIKEEELGSIINLDIEDAEEILKTLKLLNVSLDLYIQILSITNKETIFEIKELVLKGYISKTVLNISHQIFNKNNNLLNKIKINIELFNNYQVNPTTFSEQENILLMDSTLLENTLQTLERYNIIKQIKQSENFNFLFNPNLSTLIDKYLELGYENILENNLDILNYKDTRRLEIVKNMGIELTKEEIIEMYESDKFFIPDEMLDAYIPNTSVYFEDEDLCITEEDLLSYKKTTRTLEIAGNLISLNKVLKCLEKSQNIKQAIFKNMNLDLSQYQEISKELKGISYIK